MKFIFILADAYIEKPTHPKRVTVWCGFFGAEAQLAQFSSKMSEERSLQSMEIVIGPSWMTFCSQKGSMFIYGMVNSTEVLVHSKTNFVKFVQN